MKRLCLAIIVIVTTFVANSPAQAATWYTGVSCGPDQRAVIWTQSSGSGSVGGDYAYPGTFSTQYSYYIHSTGSDSTRAPGRTVYRYTVTPRNGAKVISHGVKCQ